MEGAPPKHEWPIRSELSTVAASNDSAVTKYQRGGSRLANPFQHSGNSRKRFSLLPQCSYQVLEHRAEDRPSPEAAHRKISYSGLSRSDANPEHSLAQAFGIGRHGELAAGGTGRAAPTGYRLYSRDCGGDFHAECQQSQGTRVTHIRIERSVLKGYGPSRLR